MVSVVDQQPGLNYSSTHARPLGFASGITLAKELRVQNDGSQSMRQLRGLGSRKSCQHAEAHHEGTQVRAKPLPQHASQHRSMYVCFCR